jgi:hypothetical protein
MELYPNVICGGTLKPGLRLKIEAKLSPGPQMLNA